MVLAFAAAGADAVITSRKADPCHEVAKEVEALGRRALAVGCHVGKWDEIDAMVEAAYAEFGQVDVPKVRVYTISAGPFLTDMSKSWPEEARRATRSSTGRPGDPTEIVTTALYLGSPASSYTTASLIRVDGGLY